MATTYAPSTKALSYARSLTEQTWNGTPEMLAAAKVALGTLSAKQISGVIDTLKPIAAAKNLQAAKAAAPTTDLPAGRYAVEGLDGTVMKFQVDKPTTGKWAGWTFLRNLATGEAIRDRDEKAAVLAELEAAGLLESAKLYGKVTGECGICHKTLTNPDSIAAGIGPICAGKF